MADEILKEQTEEIEDAAVSDAAELAAPDAGEEPEAVSEGEADDAGEPERPAREVNGNRETFGFLIRGLAGAYVIYLAYKIMKDMIEKGDIRWYMVLACVIFVIAGGIFIFLSLRYMSRIRKENIAEAERQEREALEREKLFAENPELKAKYEAEQAKEAAEKAASQGAAGNQRRGLFGAMSAPAAAMQPRSLTGSDIRERLRQMNEEDGIETEDISAYEEEPEDETEAGEEI